jgi:hypothetical protein
LSNSFFPAEQPEEAGGRGEARQKRHHLGSDGSSDNSSTSSDHSSCSSSDNESLRGSPPPPEAGWDRWHTLQRNLDLSISSKGIARPQSKFPHSCICKRSTVFSPSLGQPIFLQQNRQTD